ncbi:hypothetical protein ACIP5Y_26460 [Nocardia sp. NPDC088792]|uniref:hypothetical protein n=1 Tax=Nocardia sp. NPDC088792 TaxID=3364332 RepID=UPI0038288D8D
MPDVGMIYEERYSFNPKTSLFLLVAGVFVACAIFTPGGSLALRIAVALLFSVGGLLALATSLSRKVALRVDVAEINRPDRFEVD